MSTLNVTFTRGFPNVFTTQAGAIAVGSAGRSESVSFTTTGAGSLTSEDGENVVELTSDADCWVSIAESPDATANTAGERSAHFLKANIPYQYWLGATGLSVAVDAA